jgi:outer membrane protein assembly factor BamB
MIAKKQKQNLSTLSLICVSAILACSGSGRADSWPQLRGDKGHGISKEKNLPSTWSAKKGILWTTKLSGRGNSSPAVTSKRVDITTQDESNGLWIVSVNRQNGKVLKATKVGSGKLVAAGPANLYASKHNAATPSPIADETNIWAFFGSGLLVCVDAQTHKVKWSHDMVSKFGNYKITFGMASSPRLWGDLLYVACMTKGNSYVVAFNKSTGSEVWRKQRSLLAKDDGPDAYSTPVIDTSFDRDLLLLAGSDHVNAYHLATGQQEWLSDGLKIESPYGRVIASPVPTEEGIVIATSANPGGGGKGQVIAVDTRGRGDLSKKRAWTFLKSTPDSSTPVALNGLVFMATDSGIATCLSIKTGEKKWQKRLPGGPFHAALVAGDGKVYFQSTTGICSVVKADDSGEILATNTLPGTFYATPAISDGVIFLRSYEHLIAVGKK